ncbi:MAG: GTP cyclohydrolase II [Calditrichia bacterium]
MATTNESTIALYAEANLPTIYGNLKVSVFRDTKTAKEHLAILNGKPQGKNNVPVRLHSECLTSEVLGSLKCDCRDQLQFALNYICERECGIVLYLRQEGRGIGLGNKIRAYALQEAGLDTVDANVKLGFPDDLRSYDVAADMLAKLGVNSIKLLTNNPHKVAALQQLGIEVAERIPTTIAANPLNENYLRTKVNKSGHLIQLEEIDRVLDMTG